MISSDEQPDGTGEPLDGRVRAALCSLTQPPIPVGIEARVRSRLRCRRVQRTCLVAVAAAVLLLAGVLAWRPWSLVEQIPAPLPQTASTALQPAELDVLFAPPPVDPLTILATRDKESVGALKRLEGGK